MASNKSALIEQRNRLRDRLRAIEADYRRGLDADLEDQAQQLENAEVLAGIANATAQELERLEIEIERLEGEVHQDFRE